MRERTPQTRIVVSQCCDLRTPLKYVKSKIMDKNAILRERCNWTAAIVVCVLLMCSIVRTANAAQPRTLEGRVSAADYVMRGIFVQATSATSFMFDVKTWLKGEGSIGPIEIALGRGSGRGTGPPIPLFFGRGGAGTEGIVLGVNSSSGIVTYRGIEGIMAEAENNLEDIGVIVKVIETYRQIAETNLDDLTERLSVEFENPNRQTAAMAFLLYWSGFKDEDAPYRRLFLGALARKLSEHDQPIGWILTEYLSPQPLLPTLFVYESLLEDAARSAAASAVPSISETQAKVLLDRNDMYRRDENMAMSVEEMTNLPRERLNLMRINDTQNLLPNLDYAGPKVAMSAGEILEGIWEGIELPEPSGSVPLTAQSAEEQRNYWEEVIRVKQEEWIAARDEWIANQNVR